MTMAGESGRLASGQGAAAASRATSERGPHSPSHRLTRRGRRLRPATTAACPVPRPLGGGKRPLLPSYHAASPIAQQWDRRARLGATAAARGRGGAPGDSWRRPAVRPPRSCASARPPCRAVGACCAAGARRGPRARSAGAYTGGRSSQALSRSGAPRAAPRPPFAPAQSASRGGWTMAARVARERRVLCSFGRAPAWPGHRLLPPAGASPLIAKVSTWLDAQCPHCPGKRARWTWQGRGRRAGLCPGWWWGRTLLYATLRYATYIYMHFSSRFAPPGAVS